MVGDGRLAQSQGGGEVADAHGLIGLLERRHHLQPGGVGEKPEKVNGCIDCIGLELEVYRAACASLANGKADLHPFTLPNTLTVINASQ